jgi:hypothetical protein
MTDAETPAAPAPPAEAQAEEPALDLDPKAKVCGNCRLFKAVTREGDEWKGDCKLTPDRGLFPATAPICNKFMPRAAPVPRAMPKEPVRVERRPQVAPFVRKPDAGAPAQSGDHQHRDATAPAPTGDHQRTTEVPLPELENMTREELKAIVREALEDASPVRLASRWDGGTVVIKPGNPALQSKELPVDALFHKVVMLRDRLRTLEQKVNANAKLSDAEKVELQQYITRCYGSLTTFNLLFADKEDQFVGEKGKASE